MTCGKNAHHDETGEPESELGIQSPCLRMEGHKGKHVHEALCVFPSCMCQGYDKKIASITGQGPWDIYTENIVDGRHIR